MKYFLRWAPVFGAAMYYLLPAQWPADQILVAAAFGGYVVSGFADN